MGTLSDQLNLTERKAICRLRAAGRSQRQIADVLGSSPSTIGREIRRNSRQTLVRDRLEWDGCPGQIAGRLTFEPGRMVISHESTYRLASAG